MYLFLRDVKLLLRDSIYKVYKLYMNKVYLPLRDAPFEGSDKLYINTVYLFLRDVKLLLRNSIYKLLINAVYLLLRDAKLLLRDSIYKLYLKYSVPPSEGCQTPSEGFCLQVKNYKHLLLRKLFHIIAILRFCSLILLVSKDSSCLRDRRV